MDVIRHVSSLLFPDFVEGIFVESRIESTESFTQAIALSPSQVTLQAGFGGCIFISKVVIVGGVRLLSHINAGRTSLVEQCKW